MTGLRLTDRGWAVLLTLTAVTVLTLCYVIGETYVPH